MEKAETVQTRNGPTGNVRKNTSRRACLREYREPLLRGSRVQTLKTKATAVPFSWATKRKLRQYPNASRHLSNLRRTIFLVERDFVNSCRLFLFASVLAYASASTIFLVFALQLLVRCYLVAHALEVLWPL